MQISVNGNTMNFEKSLSIAQILNQLCIAQDHGIAVALNTSVISRAKLANTYVNDGDKLEIIHATAGG